MDQGDEEGGYNQDDTSAAVPSKRKLAAEEPAREQHKEHVVIVLKSQGGQDGNDVEAGSPSPYDAETDLRPRAGSQQHLLGAGNRAYLAHAAPHLFSGGPPSHDDAHSASGSNANSPTSRSPSPSLHLPKSSSSHVATSSKHKVPPHFRGPMPRDSDAEEIAPQPALLPVPGSVTMFQPHNTPINRNGWRYTFAGPCTSSMPYSVYRSIPSHPAHVRWDWSDRSGFTKMAHQADIVTSDKGWRSARGNVPVRQGSWYCEVEILPPEDPAAALAAGADAAPLAGQQHASAKDGPHVRLGWARREAPLNAPVGFDAYSYGLRDTTGQRVLLSRPLPYGDAFRAGDVVGMYIHIPPLSKPALSDVRDPRHIRRRRIPIRYRGQIFFEQLEYAQSKEMEYLMERSWAGEQLTRPDGSLALQRGPAGLEPDSQASDRLAAASGARGKRFQKEQAPSQPTAPPGTGKSKRQSGPGTASSKDTKAKPRKQLRPLPTLGESSRIGFFLNGRPQGWAFRDLLDFRQLRSVTGDAKTRKKEAAGSKGSGREESPAAAAASADEMAAAGLGLDDMPPLRTSASLAAIMKSRENPYDDGSTGYFPFVSLYGGARAKIRAGPAEMRYPPVAWDKVEEALDQAERAKRSADDVPSNADTANSRPNWWGQTRPLSERFSEYWSEQWTYDIEEEERAQIRAKYWKPPEDDDDEPVRNRTMGGFSEGHEASPPGGRGMPTKATVGTAGSTSKRKVGSGGGGSRRKEFAVEREHREWSSTTKRESCSTSEKPGTTPSLAEFATGASLASPPNLKTDGVRSPLADDNAMDTGTEGHEGNGNGVGPLATPLASLSDLADIAMVRMAVERQGAVGAEAGAVDDRGNDIEVDPDSSV